MVNLLIYINPRKDFDDEAKRMARIQIDNSLEMGWKREDIVIATNFPYEYNGVKAILLSGDNYCEWLAQLSKINALMEMFRRGLIGKDTHWFHDFDAFQNAPFPEMNMKELAITDYGYYRKWNTGSFFFTDKARDVFELIHSKAHEWHKDEERTLMRLTDENFNNINARYTQINATYNFPGSTNGLNKLSKMWDRIDKPIRVLHFHPSRRDGVFFEAIKGKNRKGISLINNNLLNIFKKHGY